MMLLDDVIRLVEAANERRWQSAESADAEQQLETQFGIKHKLAVYGTLAPGRENYHMVEPYGGEWTPGVVEGDLFEYGWGAAFGYPAFAPRPGGPIVNVQVLTAPLLVQGWPRLDEFEGKEYCRILVPVFSSIEDSQRNLFTVANLYASVGACQR